MKRYVWLVAAAVVGAIAVAAAVAYLSMGRRADPNNIRIATDGDLPPFGFIDAEGTLQGEVEEWEDA